MRKLIIAAALAIGLFSCLDKDGDNTTFDQQEFAGKYKVDMSSIISDVKNDTSKIENGFLRTLAVGAVSTVSMEINFYPDGKGFYTTDFGVFGLLVDEKIEQKEFTYEIKNDSVLYMNNYKDGIVSALDTAYLKKVGGRYDIVEVRKKGKERLFRLIRQE